MKLMSAGSLHVSVSYIGSCCSPQLHLVVNQLSKTVHAYHTFFCPTILSCLVQSIGFQVSMIHKGFHVFELLRSESFRDQELWPSRSLQMHYHKLKQSLLQ